MIYILVWLIVTPRITTSSAEFSSYETCQKAGQEMYEMWNKDLPGFRSNRFNWICVKK